MAVAEHLQQRGVGRMLLTFMLDDLHDRRELRPFVWCNARENAAGFYARLGWRRCSEVYPNSHAGPSITMVREGS